MGCYGIGPTRIMGSIVEIFNDEKGIIWPKSVAPYHVHIVSLGTDEKVNKAADKLYKDLAKAGIEVMYDDRDERAGVKLNDADLIGIPLRIVVSSRTLEKDSVEWKERSSDDAKEVKMKDLLKAVKEFL